MLKGHLPRVVYHQVYWYTKISGLRISRDLAEDAQGTPTQSHISPSILVYEERLLQDFP